MTGVTIGGVNFDGVKVLKQEIKGTGSSKTYCVWTDAGYMEYKEQSKNKNGFVDTTLHAVKNPDLGANSLFIVNLTNATLKLNSSNYQAGVGITGKGDGFTLDAQNGQKEILISVFNNTKVIKDDFDNVQYNKIKF